jgi:hypothetical protein
MKRMLHILKSALGLSLWLLLLLPVHINAETLTSQDSNLGKNIRLNPQYKISRISNGDVIITSKNPAEKEVKHKFTDFYADLLMAAYRQQSIDNMVISLKKKYYLSEDDCRRELKHAINVLMEWKIILRDGQMAIY